MGTFQRAVIWAGATLCLVVGSMLGGQADGQQLDLVRPALPLTDQSALICEAGDLLGAGGQTHSDTTSFFPVDGLNRRRILIELVTRIDVDRDRNLDHRELQTLDYLTRQQLLQQLDTNHDRKLSLQELEQEPLENSAREPAPSEQLYPSEPTASTPPQPETFRNLRRFGIGIQQTLPTPRSQPFARAATFGTSPNFPRPVTKQSIDRRSGGGGSCRPTSDLYLRVSRPR